jgi:translation initiation factor 1
MATKQKTNPGWNETSSAPMNNAFAALASKLPASVVSEKPPVLSTVASTEPAPAAAPARAVVRFERKGHGGKTATVVSHLGLAPAQIEIWCAEARKKLGCGGTVEGDTIVLQGDQRDRAAAWLTAKGVKRVTTA